MPTDLLERPLQDAAPPGTRDEAAVPALPPSSTMTPPLPRA
ncbi:hypothetical protein ACF073_34380 [Streptomyces sp. NPDC015171]